MEKHGGEWSKANTRLHRVTPSPQEFSGERANLEEAEYKITKIKLAVNI